MRTLGNAVGKDSIIAVANVCKRDVIVYSADAEPLVYKFLSADGSSKLPSIKVAFYEPGHYRAVFGCEEPIAHVGCEFLFTSMLDRLFVNGTKFVL